MNKSGKSQTEGTRLKSETFFQRYLPHFLITPSTLIIFGVLIAPIAYALFMSFNTLNLARRSFEFVGVNNYVQMFGDQNFLKSAGTTLLFTLLTVTAEIVLGVAVALVLNKQFIGRGFVRGLMILPWALPTVVNAIMWKWIFNANYGVFNAIMVNIGVIERYQVWLGQPVSAFVCVLVANIWKETPYVVLLTIAALATISEDLYEAGKIDGANGWQAFWKITLPLIKPVVLILTITKTIWALQTFDLVYIMTAGGPMSATEFMTFLIHKNAFKFQKFGYSSAMSFTLSMLCFFLTYLYIKLFMGREDGGRRLKPRKLKTEERMPA